MSRPDESTPPKAAPPERGASPFRTPNRDDVRVGYGSGWVLIAGMVCLASVFLGIIWNTAPRAWRGWAVGAGTAAALFFLLAPAAAVFTRKLYQRQRSRRRADGSP